MNSIRLSGPSDRMQVHADNSFENWTAVSGEKVVDDLKLEPGHAALNQSEFPAVLKESGAQHAKAAFIPKEEFGLGREESRHEVQFGQFVLNGLGIHEKPLFASVKPFENTADQLPVEWAASAYLNSLNDRQLAFLPLGVWRNVDGIYQLISLYEHDVTTYDHVFWADKNLQPEALRPRTVEEAFYSCMYGIGYLHGAGIAHGDAEAKNLAADRQGVRFVDLEDIHVLDRDSPSTLSISSENNRTMRRDIETFIDSTMQVDENRNIVAKILTERGITQKLSLRYLDGFKQGSTDAGLKQQTFSVQHEASLQGSIDHALGNFTHTQTL